MPERGWRSGRGSPGGIGGRMTRGQRKDGKKWPEELEEGCDKVMEGSFGGHRGDWAEKGWG